MIITNITGIGDPQIVLFEGKYYCYATDPFDLYGGIRVWVSEDLEHWSDQILCFKAIESWGYRCFWAPEVIYHNGKFVMHYSARSRELDSLRVGVAVSDSPTGPFVDVWDKPMFDFGYAAIDASVLVTEQGNYLYYSRDCCENILDGIKTSQLYCVEVDDTLTRVIGEPKMIATPMHEWEKKSLLIPNYSPHLWNEGPFVIPYNGKYLMNYSATCYATNDYAICLAVAEEPMGPWIKPESNNPVLSCREGLFGAGHNAFFHAKDGTLMTAFHIQTNPEKPSGDRTVVIGKVILEEKSGIITQNIV